MTAGASIRGLREEIADLFEIQKRILGQIVIRDGDRKGFFEVEKQVDRRHGVEPQLAQITPRLQRLSSREEFQMRTDNGCDGVEGGGFDHV